MAGPSKKPKPADESQSSDESMDEQQEENEFSGTEIAADFDGRFLGPEHYHGIKRLLQQLFLKADIDLSQITEMLIRQTGIGSVLQQAIDDSDCEEDSSEEITVFAVTSVLKFTLNNEAPSCMKQLFSLLDLTIRNASKEVQENIEKIFQNNKIGFILHERIVNIPAKISVPMLTNLVQEMHKAKVTDKSYDFDYLVIISKTLKPKVDKDGKGETFTNEEEQFFYKNAEWTFDFSVEKDCDFLVSDDGVPDDERLVPFRRVSIFKAGIFKNIVDTITKAINNN